METTARLEQVAMTDTYEDVSAVIRSVVFKFWKAYGGEFEELLAEANMIFMDVYQDWDAARGIFGKRIRYLVWARLFDSMRIKASRNSRCRREYIDVETCPQKPQRSVPELLEELSQDAQTIVRMTLETPPEFSTLFNHKGRLRKTPRKAIRKRIRNALLEMGWSVARIVESFDEIGRVVMQ